MVFKPSFDLLYAHAYIAYMIVGSYFYKIRPNRFLIKAYLHYVEMSLKSQYFMESCVIRQMEKLSKTVCIQDLCCEVYHNKCDDRMELLFYTGFDDISVIVTRDRIEVCKR